VLERYSLRRNHAFGIRGGSTSSLRSINSFLWDLGEGLLIERVSLMSPHITFGWWTSVSQPSRWRRIFCRGQADSHHVSLSKLIRSWLNPTKLKKMYLIKLVSLKSLADLRDRMRRMWRGNIICQLKIGLASGDVVSRSDPI
jgi:hypothetical protein